MSEIALDHIAIAATRIADAPEFLVGALGGVSGFGGPAGDYRWWHWDYPGGGRIEVIEPDGFPGGFVHRFLEQHGTGIHHVTFNVADLGRICERARSSRYAVVGEMIAGSYAEAFLHPKSAMGIVVQLCHYEPGGVDQSRLPRMEPPPQPTPAHPAARVLGLRMCTQDRERARLLWQELLGGQPEERAEDLIFRWPGSAMRIRVRIEAGSEDRAEAIELAESPRPVPSSPHPELGARFETLATP